MRSQAEVTNTAPDANVKSSRLYAAEPPARPRSQPIAKYHCFCGRTKTVRWTSADTGAALSFLPAQAT